MAYLRAPVAETCRMEPVVPFVRVISKNVRLDAINEKRQAGKSVSGPKSETATSQRGSRCTATLMTRRHNPEGSVMTFRRCRNLTSPNVSRCNCPP